MIEQNALHLMVCINILADAVRIYIDLTYMYIKSKSRKYSQATLV